MMSGQGGMVKAIRFSLLCVFGAIMLFPMVWIVCGSLKPLE